MNEEQIIRNEAQEFFDHHIQTGRSYNAVENIRKLNERLADFYSSENKAIFLDEIEILLKNDLQEHITEFHGGQPKPGCGTEVQAEKLFFYVKQEIDTLPKIAHQKFKDQVEYVRNKVFISYSHFDKEFLNEIQRHFKPFLKKIDLWDDSKILPGQKWKDEIRKALNETKVAILLVSTDFLGSEFISTDELPPLLKAAEEAGAVILNLIVRPVLFEEFPDLNQFQAMNPPSRPVSKMNSDEREDLYVNLVRQTKRILNDL